MKCGLLTSVNARWVAHSEDRNGHRSAYTGSTHHRGSDHFGKESQALIAYDCAIFGLIPCVCSVLGPVALVLGILSRSAIRNNPMLPGKAHAWVGIILGGIETLLGVIAIAAMVLEKALRTR